MLKKVLKGINTAEYLLAGFLFCAALTVLFLNVIFRRIPQIPAFNFAEEFMRYCSIWITFVGMSICAEEDSHVGVDIIYQMSKSRRRKILKILCMLAAVVFCGFFTFSCCKYVLLAMKNMQRSPVMQVPLWIIYLALLIGAFLSTIQYLLRLIYFIRIPHEDLAEKPAEDSSDINLLDLN